MTVAVGVAVPVNVGFLGFGATMRTHWDCSGLRDAGLKKKTTSSIKD